MNTRTREQRGAEIIRRGFNEFHETFRAITRRSVERFERRDWDGIRRDTVRRFDLHSQALDATRAALLEHLGDEIRSEDIWPGLKEAYSTEILGSDDFELAQTFFNSLRRDIFEHTGVESQMDYLARDFSLPFQGWDMASARMYAVRRVNEEVTRKVLEDAGFRVPFRDLEADALATAEKIREALRQKLGSEELETLDFLRPVFIRNKAAYLIGRARSPTGVLPLVLPILNREEGLVVDGVVHDEDEISIIFSFARWYFHADLATPRQVIGFLHSLLPRKRISELYISLGYHKHGKSEFYADLTNYIAHTKEYFVVAPGERGLIMAVFTLPSYEFVFKVIRDRFPASKQTTRRKIRERYRQVMLHDRVGRLVDFQEYEHLEFPRERFSQELLNELVETAAKNVELHDETVAIRHLYVGRRVTPLNLFLRTAEPAAQERAILDWGNAIKELAASGIFAGDMLLKNFGVTRHGRVVFYDYDELCPLSECRFRRFPEARNDDDLMAAEPWFTVRDGDIFPSELRTFLGLTGSLRDTFEKEHGNLFECDFWRAMQKRTREGEIIDFFPYSDSKGLRSDGLAYPPIS